MILRHERSAVNLLHIYRTSFSKNTSRRLFLFYEAPDYRVTFFTEINVTFLSYLQHKKIFSSSYNGKGETEAIV